MQQVDINAPRKLRSSSKTDTKEPVHQGQGIEDMEKMTGATSQNGEVTNEQIWEAITAIQYQLSDLPKSTTQGKVISLESVEALQQTEANRINSLEQLVREQDVKLRILTNIVIRQEETLTGISQTITNLRRNKLRQNVRISGVVEDKDETKTVTKEKVQKFMKEKLEITEPPEIKQAFRVGPKSQVGNDREIVAKLVNQRDKGLIFTNAKNLKDKKNPKRKLYFVNDDLDPTQAEEKKIFRELKKENKDLQDDKKMTIKFVRNRIVVDNEIITPEVAPPTASDVLRLTDVDRINIKQTKLIAADEHSEDMSDYATFVQKVKNIDDVRRGYYKMRIRFGDATHISCGYRLVEVYGPYRQQGIDDGEIGAGRTILSVLKQKAVTNLCIFVVRWYGGKHLGKRRFQILEMLSNSAIRTYQFKTRDRQARLQRSLSQTSLDSVLSQPSDISFDTAEENMGGVGIRTNEVPVEHGQVENPDHPDQQQPQDKDNSHEDT